MQGEWWRPQAWAVVVPRNHGILTLGVRLSPDIAESVRLWRRAVMQKWSDYVTGAPSADVIPLHG